jgi:hypothetical protein
LQHKRELKSVKRDALQGLLDLYYFDEAGFSMTPSVPYGWQPPGERFEIPSSRSGQLNVLGFMRHDGKQLTPYVFEGAIDTEVVIACMDDFSKDLSIPTTVVIDNAPIHNSAAFQKMIPEWEEKNLYFWFLPPYCPELNLIEILWNKIKYTWMPMEAYSSWEMLDQSLSRILKDFGKQFVINFK